MEHEQPHGSTESILAHSPAKRVHDNEVLRREIAQHLTQGELVKTCMRVSEGWLATASEEVYKEADGDRFGELVRSSQTSPRFTPVYLAAIRKITADDQYSLSDARTLFLSVVQAAPGTQRIIGPMGRSAREWEIDLVNKRIYKFFRHDFEGPEDPNVKALQLSDADQWPESYILVAQMTLVVTLGFEAFGKLVLRDLPKRCSSRVEYQVCRIVMDHHSDNVISLPDWSKDLSVFQSLHNIGLNGNLTVTTDDIIRMLQSATPALQRLQIGSDSDMGSGFWSTSSGYRSGHWPSIADVPRILRAASARTDMSLFHFGVMVNPKSAKLFAQRAIAEAARHPACQPRPRKTDVLFGGYQVVTAFEQSAIGVDLGDTMGSIIMGFYHLRMIPYPMEDGVICTFPADQPDLSKLFISMRRQCAEQMGWSE